MSHNIVENQLICLIKVYDFPQPPHTFRQVLWQEPSHGTFQHERQPLTFCCSSTSNKLTFIEESREDNSSFFFLIFVISNIAFYI